MRSDVLETIPHITKNKMLCAKKTDCLKIQRNLLKMTLEMTEDFGTLFTFYKVNHFMIRKPISAFPTDTSLTLSLN